MAENRQAAGAGERTADDVAGGGYEGVALALMRALATGRTTRLVLNVRNRGTLPSLDADAVVELPCRVDATGVRPEPTDPLPAHAAGLVTAVKAVEREVMTAAETGSRAAAVRAFALHPLVDSAHVADRLTTAYAEAHPELAHLRG